MQRGCGERIRRTSEASAATGLRCIRRPRQCNSERLAVDAGPAWILLESRRHGRACPVAAPRARSRMRGHSRSSRVACSVTSWDSFRRQPRRRRFSRCRRAVAHSPRIWFFRRRHPVTAGRDGAAQPFAIIRIDAERMRDSRARSHESPALRSRHGCAARYHN